MAKKLTARQEREEAVRNGEFFKGGGVWEIRVTIYDKGIILGRFLERHPDLKITCMCFNRETYAKNSCDGWWTVVTEPRAQSSS